ncbi:hypothetical protein Tco_0190120 [Tanacetum coccineum]
MSSDTKLMKDEECESVYSTKYRGMIEMKQQGDDVASWWPWNVFEVLVSCYGDVMEPTSVSVKWLPFTNRNSDEAQTSEHVLGQMTYPIASLTPDSARSYVMQGAPFTQGTIPSIPIGGSINPEGFLSSILLLVVIIVTVLIVVVILVVVVIAIVGVVIVVVIIRIVVVVGGVSSIFKHSFVIIGVLRRIVFYYLLHQPLSYVPSQMTYFVASPTLDSASSCEFEDNTSYQKKSLLNSDQVIYRLLHIPIDWDLLRTKLPYSEGGNIEDGVKIAGGVIGSGGGIESSEELKEVLPDVADEAEV